MLRPTVLLYVLFLLFMTPADILSQDDTVSIWEYMGQSPPNDEAVVFAPGVISGLGRMHCFPSFSQDGKEIVWMKLPPKLFYVEFDKSWSNPTELAFLNQFRAMFPVHGFEDQRLYFASGSIDGSKGSMDLWYVEKEDSTYSDPVNLGSLVNTPGLETQPTLTGSGTIYYTGIVPGKRWNRGILVSRYQNGRYSKPQILDTMINIIDTNAIDYTPFIAKDESFLLFSSNRQNIQNEGCRIYISFKDENESWTAPLNISEAIGFNHDSRNPYVSPDGKYLFFCSGNHIYWVSAGVIERFR